MRSKKIIAVLLSVIMLVALLAACGEKTEGKSDSGDSKPSNDGTGTSTGTGSEGNGEVKVTEDSITDLVTYQISTGEIVTWNILYTQAATDGAVLTNCVSGLLQTDPHGNIVPDLAESYEMSADGLTWTFHLRDGVKWVDYNGNEMADVVAQDWITSLEWVFNYWKNEGANISMYAGLIDGAEEYYNMTKDLEEQAAYDLDISEFTNMVKGIEAPDDSTVIYHLTRTCPYFPSLAVYSALSPLSAELLATTTPEDYKGADNTGIWYCGPYTVTEFVRANEKVFTKNPLYWDDSVLRFDTVTVKMLESHNVAFELFKNGEIDTVTLQSSTVASLAEGDPLYDYMCIERSNGTIFQFDWNYAKNNEDGTPDTNWNTAIANESFRKAIYYGVDLTEYLTNVNPLDPLYGEAYTLSAETLCTTSDGRDYTDLVYDKLGIERTGETFARYDASKAEDYKKSAIEELTPQGVTFPVEVDYYIASGNQGALDSANILKKCFETGLGSDFVTFNICTYVTSYANEVRNPSLQSYYPAGWMADYGDPLSYLEQWIIGSDNAYFANYYDHFDQSTDEVIALVQEYTDMVNEANAIIDDMDARYEKFAEAEAFLIDHALIFSIYQSNGVVLTNINAWSKVTGVFGGNSGRYINWETNSNGYTRDEYTALRDEFYGN